MAKKTRKGASYREEIISGREDHWKIGGKLDLVMPEVQG
jgi:hypothetical protein